MILRLATAKGRPSRTVTLPRTGEGLRYGGQLYSSWFVSFDPVARASEVLEIPRTHHAVRARAV